MPVVWVRFYPLANIFKDLRVGRILEAKRHPDADSLYVETIDFGEESPRTVVSGLAKFIPLEDLQGKMIVGVCNLKPSKLRGILSQAMVLAASDAEHTVVELVVPADGSKPGDIVEIDGFTSTPDAQLNPKHKVWEKVQPGLKTDDACVATYKGAVLKTPSGKCSVASLKDSGIA
jgi:methionine--tRNA ligase beta chain